MCGQPALEICGIHRAGLTGDLLPVLEDGKGGNAADVVAGSELLLGFRIHLCKAGTGSQFTGGLGKNRRHHFARTTP